MDIVNGKTYRFINVYHDGYGLNIYGTKDTDIKGGQNVCLYSASPTDQMQQWKAVAVSGASDVFQLEAVLNSIYVLDCSDGSISTSYKNNAHMCKKTGTSAVDSGIIAEPVQGNQVRICLPEKNLYLTATTVAENDAELSNNISTLAALRGGSTGRGNVYWASPASEGSMTWKKQCWEVVEVGGGTDPDPEPHDFAWPTESRQIVRSVSADHDGMDIAPLTPRVPGDDIYAFMDGVVSAVVNPTTNPNEGYSVRIHHVNPINNGYENIRTQYMHMQSMPLVSEKQEVKAGQLLGYMGNTGNVYPKPTPDNPGAGTHLHFEIRGGTKNDFPLYGTSKFYTGTVLNPEDYLALCD